jgi:hypothetical protein
MTKRRGMLAIDTIGIGMNGNVPQLGEVADFGIQKMNFSTKLN